MFDLCGTIVVLIVVLGLAICGKYDEENEE